MWNAVRTIGPVLTALGVFVTVSSSGCSLKNQGEKHYYDQHIQPIFNGFCVGNTSPCHKVDPTSGIALGNLDLSSYENVHKRPDVLRTYGSYPLPLLLMKAVTESSVSIPYQDQSLTSEIRHAGGKPLSTNSDAFFALQTWLQNGANRDGIAPAIHSNQGSGDCNTALPPDRDTTMVDTSSNAYALFLSDVQPKLKMSCAYATCHSSPQSDFYITCGADDAQLRFNYLQASGFVAPAPAMPEQSEILLRPLNPAAGGVSHTGGIFFDSRNDEGWQKWRAWAVAVQASPPVAMVKSAGQTFFEANVMPTLLKRGCASEGCHSPNGFNDFRLRPGAQGFFAPLALKRNYETTLREFMALDTIDVRQSRAVKKTIFSSSGGIPHRAGSVLESESFDTSVGTCPTPYAPATANAFCTLAEWHRIERADHAASVSPMADGDVLPIVFVSRPPDPDNLLQFDTFRGGADLMMADAKLGARGAVTSVTNARSLLGPCAGLVAGTADVRGPDFSYDATKVVFAGRPSESSGLDLWVIDLAAKTCRQLTSDGGRLEGAVKVHNFDPMFAPNGAIVFSSTRAGTLTPKTFLPNADLFRTGPDADFTAVERMTYLLASEIGAAMMQDGRVSFTAEKATPDFYQVSGRRMNWDLSDYHPLLAQRAQSTDTFNDTLHPSVGFSQATEIREGLDRNFLVILSDVGALGGGGALATFNRSVGPFEADRPERTFLKAVSMVDPAATGQAGTVGVYRSPSSLPNGEILASYAANVQDPMSDTPRYALVAVAPAAGDPPVGGSRRMLLGDASHSYVEATMGYKRTETELFRNLPQLVFGGHVDAGVSYGIMHFPDLPMLATLLNANLRRGRDVAAFDNVTALRIYEERPPPGPNPGGLMGTENVYVDRVSLGSANLEPDHSLKVYVPANKPLILELVDASGNPVFTMREEHQVTAGEYVTPGVPRTVFNGVCGGCHGSISGEELDVAVTPDALTGASVSRSRDLDPKPLN